MLFPQDQSRGSMIYITKKLSNSRPTRESKIRQPFEAQFNKNYALLALKLFNFSINAGTTSNASPTTP